IAALLLAAGAPKKRFALPNSRILIHQPWLSGLSGQATDIDIHAKEILRMRTVINTLLAQHSSQPPEKIEKDVERDFIMSAQQAKDYGLIADIIHKPRWPRAKQLVSECCCRAAGEKKSLEWGERPAPCRVREG